MKLYPIAMLVISMMMAQFPVSTAIQTSPSNSMNRTTEQSNNSTVCLILTIATTASISIISLNNAQTAAMLYRTVINATNTLTMS
jgi:hypothetical protein